MLRILLFAGVLGIVLGFASAERRHALAEALRDLSDRLMALLLRSTSGFAADVPRALQEEEREWRLRWR